MDSIFYLFNPWWENKKFFTGTNRDKYLAQIKNNLKNRQAVLLVGSRRVGKTVLLHQTIKYLLDTGAEPHRLVYLPLDHPSLQGKKILGLLEEIRQIHGLKRSEKLFLFLDEVQFFPNWEQEAKAITDFENAKLVISGSASTKILAKGAFLTGRTLTLMIKPFDFNEFIMFSGKTIGKTDKALKSYLLKKYLQIGGYPEYVKNQNPLYFSDLITSVVNKDIATLFPVKNTALVSRLLALLADRVGSQTSLTKLGKILDLTKDTVKDYIYYLSSTFLVSQLGKYSTSRNVTLYSPKKFYLLDPGLLFNLTGKLNLGVSAENTVFQKISSAKKIGFYFENQKEIDFIVDNEIYEVKYELSHLGWEKLAGQIKKLPTKRFKKITILTENLRKSETVNNIKIEFQCLSDFLLFFSIFVI
jgi:predicted AAA+ superfamily ATPase